MIVLMFLALFGSQARAEEADERRDLLGQQTRLSQKVSALKREQDLLLFRKTMYQSDAKYLLIDLKTRTGSLYYRNRVLRSFPVVLHGRAASQPGTGAVILSVKTEGKPRERTLLFGKDMVMYTGKRAALTGENKQVFRIELGAKDLASIYSALEVGARAYVMH